MLRVLNSEGKKIGPKNILTLSLTSEKKMKCLKPVKIYHGETEPTKVDKAEVLESHNAALRELV